MPDEAGGKKEPTPEEMEERLKALLGDDDLPPERIEELEGQLRAIEADLDAASEKRQGVGAQVDAEFHERIEAIRRRAKAAQGEFESTKRTRAEQLHEQGQNAKGLGIGLSIGYAILGLPLAGYGAGWLLDKQFGSNLMAGFGMLIGATLAVGYAIAVLNRNPS